MKNYLFLAVTPVTLLLPQGIISQSNCQKSVASYSKLITLKNQSPTMNFIEKSLQSTDWESRYMSLYFLSRLIDEGKELEYAQTITKSMLNDESETVKTQAMWCLCKLVNRNLLIDTAAAEAKKNILSEKSSLRMWALELYENLAQNSINLHEANKALALCKNDMNPLVSINTLFLQDKLKKADTNLGQIVRMIKSASQLPHWEDRHFDLYFVYKLVDSGKELTFAQTIVLKALNDTAKLKIQALWVLSKLVDRGQCLSKALEIAKKEILDSDWHVHFGALMVFEALTKKRLISVDDIAYLVNQAPDYSNSFAAEYQRMILNQSTNNLK